MQKLKDETAYECRPEIKVPYTKSFTYCQEYISVHGDMVYRCVHRCCIGLHRLPSASLTTQVWPRDKSNDAEHKRSTLHAETCKLERSSVTRILTTVGQGVRFHTSFLPLLAFLPMEVMVCVRDPIDNQTYDSYWSV